MSSKRAKLPHREAPVTGQLRVESPARDTTRKSESVSIDTLRRHESLNSPIEHDLINIHVG